MANMKAARRNVALDATVAASSEATEMPVSLIQQEDVSRHFRSGAVSTVDIDFTYDEEQSVDVLSFLGTNLTETGTIRLKFSNVALGGVDIHDTGVLTDVIDPVFLTTPRQRGEDVLVQPGVVDGWKFLRATLADASLSFIETGLAFFSTATQVSENFAWSSSNKWVTLSQHNVTRGGMTRVIVRPRHRQFTINLDLLTETERWGLVEAIDIDNGIDTPVLFMLNPAADPVGRHTVYGLLESLNPNAYVKSFDDSGNPKYARNYVINERL